MWNQDYDSSDVMRHNIETSQALFTRYSLRPAILAQTRRRKVDPKGTGYKATCTCWSRRRESRSRQRAADFRGTLHLQRQHAQPDMRPHPRCSLVEHRPQFRIDGLERQRPRESSAMLSAEYIPASPTNMQRPSRQLLESSGWLGDLDSNQSCPVQSREFYR